VSTRADHPPLAEPRTLAELIRAIEIRNASYLSSTRGLPRAGSQQLKDLMITPGKVLSELLLVIEGVPGGAYPIRDFLGGIGLITRFGFEDTITEAGLALVGPRSKASEKAAR